MIFMRDIPYAPLSVSLSPHLIWRPTNWDGRKFAHLACSINSLTINFAHVKAKIWLIRYRNPLIFTKPRRTTTVRGKSGEWENTFQFRILGLLGSPLIISSWGKLK